MRRIKWGIYAIFHRHNIVRSTFMSKCYVMSSWRWRKYSLYGCAYSKKGSNVNYSGFFFPKQIAIVLLIFLLFMKLKDGEMCSFPPGSCKKTVWGFVIPVLINQKMQNV